MLLARMQDLGLKEEDYSAYLDTRRFGAHPRPNPSPIPNPSPSPSPTPNPNPNPNPNRTRTLTRTLSPTPSPTITPSLTPSLILTLSRLAAALGLRRWLRAARALRDGHGQHPRRHPLPAHGRPDAPLSRLARRPALARPRPLAPSSRRLRDPLRRCRSVTRSRSGGGGTAAGGTTRSRHVSVGAEV